MGFHQPHLFAFSLLLLATPGSAQDIRVGSKNFPESRLLGEIFTQALEARTDLEVEHVAGLAGTLVAFTALREGELDLYPEYTGTGWAVLLERTDRAPDPVTTYLEVAEESRLRWGLEWLSPLGFDNTYALAVQRGLAEERGLRTISDLARLGSDLRGGFSSEFMEREDGYPGLAQTYGLALARARGMEHGLTYGAIAAGELDVIDVYSTDGRLARHDLVLLEDDLGFFPPYEAVPLVRGDALARHPQARAILQRLAGTLDDAEMTRLNHAVEVEGRTASEVAGEFLATLGWSRLQPDPGAGVDGSNASSAWTGTGRRLFEHMVLTLLAVGLAASVGIPLGIFMQGRPAWERVSLGVAGILQTVPGLALLAIAITIPGLGLNARSAVLALTLYAVLPILRNTHAGVRSVDGELVEAARAIGLSPRETLLRVQLPLATGTILAGVRTATVVTVGMATLAAFIGAGGLGEPIVTGLALNDPELILAGAVPAAILALAADAGLGRLEVRLTPRGLRRGGGGEHGGSSGGS